MKKILMSAIIFALGLCTCMPSFGMQKKSPEQRLVDIDYNADIELLTLSLRKLGALGLGTWGVCRACDHLVQAFAPQKLFHPGHMRSWPSLENMAFTAGLLCATKLLWGKSYAKLEEETYRRVSKLIATSPIDMTKCAADPACVRALELVQMAMRSHEEKNG